MIVTVLYNQKKQSIKISDCHSPIEQKPTKIQSQSQTTRILQQLLCSKQLMEDRISQQFAAHFQIILSTSLKINLWKATVAFLSIFGNTVTAYGITRCHRWRIKQAVVQSLMESIGEMKFWTFWPSRCDTRTSKIRQKKLLQFKVARYHQFTNEKAP